MKNILRIPILLIIITVLISCDPFCSGHKIKKDDQLKIEIINSKYDLYNLEIDKCLPLGYFNLTINDEKIVDTLMIDKIFYEVLDKNITAKEMQVFNKHGKLIYIQNNYYNPNRKTNKPIRLKLEDL
ncbi:hypothetical protein N9Q58_02115 [Polaribacter sp.]|nr:hypothetical protein [Polaribacter sp.]